MTAPREIVPAFARRTWTSPAVRARSSAAPACMRVPQRRVAALLAPLVIEDRPRHRRVAVGEAEVAEPAGWRVLETAQVLDLELNERCLVRLSSTVRHTSNVGEGANSTTQSKISLFEHLVDAGAGSQLSSGRRFRPHERHGVRDGLEAEARSTKRAKTRYSTKRRRRAVELRRVPAEVEVRVGAGATEAGSTPESGSTARLGRRG